MQKQKQNLPLVNLNQLIKEHFPRTKKIYGKSEVLLGELLWNENLLKSLAFARRCGTLRGGLENIEHQLLNEQAGLDKLNEKNKDNLKRKYSRILLVTNDGSERFYHRCEMLLLKYSHRVFAFSLNVSSETLGEALFGKGKHVKSLLVIKKEMAEKILSEIVKRK